MLCATMLAACLLRHSVTSCRTCCKPEDFASPASKPFPLWYHCHVGFHPQLSPSPARNSHQHVPHLTWEWFHVQPVLPLNIGNANLRWKIAPGIHM